MYFKNKDDTNIDDEFREEELKNRSQKTMKIAVIVSLSTILLGSIIFIISYLSGKLILEGSKELTIYQGTRYIEPGYIATGFGNSDKSSDVVITGQVDTTNIGTYELTYKYKLKKVKRTVKVIAQPSIITIIHLNGSTTITLNVGDQYVEPGYSAIDAIDGDLTSKVKITSKVDTSKKGTYRIVYSVVNSKGVTTSESRTVVVK